jgi:heptosyltransferase II
VRTKPTVEAPRRLLVKEPNWLGDLVISLPALAALRRAFPAAHLAVLVKHELAGFFEGVDWVDETIGYRMRSGVRRAADRVRVVSTIRAAQFDLAVLFPKSFEAALWAALGGVPRRAGIASQGRGILLTDAAPAPAAPLDGHQSSDYLRMLADTLGIDVDVPEVRFAPAQERRRRMRDWLASRRRRAGGPLVALAPAAAYGPAKEWPGDRYSELIDRLADGGGAECVLVGAPPERARSAEIASKSTAGAIVAAGETDVADLVALLSLCEAFAGNDSGAMHVAAALGIPTVGIFGSTNPDRTGPLGPRTRVVYEKIACSPCFDRTCRFGHYDCLNRIAVDEVLRSLRELRGFSRT